MVPGRGTGLRHGDLRRAGLVLTHIRLGVGRRAAEREGHSKRGGGSATYEDSVDSHDAPSWWISSTARRAAHYPGVRQKRDGRRR